MGWAIAIITAIVLSSAPWSEGVDLVDWFSNIGQPVEVERFLGKLKVIVGNFDTCLIKGLVVLVLVLRAQHLFPSSG